MTTPATPETRHRCASDTLADRVAQACAQEFGVTVEQIYGRGRWEPLSVARQATMYVLQVDFSLHPRLTATALQRERQTGIWSRERIQERLETNQDNFRARIDRIRMALKPTWWVI